MHWNDIFTRLGFGKNAGDLYKTVFDSKTPMLAAHIAKTMHIDRPEVYRNLKVLIPKKIIKKITIKGRTLYVANSPGVVYDLFMEAVSEVNDLVEKTISKKLKEVPANITYFSGAKGIGNVFDTIVAKMPKGGKFYRYTSEKNLEEVNSFLSKDYRKMRDEKKIERLVISNPLSGRAKKPRLERFIKFIPPEKDMFDQNIIQLVYADSVAFINLNTQESYIIQDKDLARFQEVIFKQLYKRL